MLRATDDNQERCHSSVTDLWSLLVLRTKVSFAQSLDTIGIRLRRLKSHENKTKEKQTAQLRGFVTFPARASETFVSKKNATVGVSPSWMLQNACVNKRWVVSTDVCVIRSSPLP